MSRIAACTCSATARRTSSSPPKIFTATLARVPDSMWSMRCEIGCPTWTLVPGIKAARSRTSATIAALERSLKSSPTSISDDSTPCKCSSDSARPVRRPVETTPGVPSKILSSAVPRRSESPKLVPGTVTAVIVRLPSFNSGKNVRPACCRPSTAAATSSSATDITTTALSKPQRKTGS